MAKGNGGVRAGEADEAHMKVLGIVGHAQEKFTECTEAAARDAIRQAIAHMRPDAICSGRSHLMGVDAYAEEIAGKLGLEFIPHEPETHQWNPPGLYGYKLRNLDIANTSSVVLSVVVRQEALPPAVLAALGGLNRLHCYHCRGRVPDHVKSGGCWTAWKARERGWRIIGADGSVLGHGE